ncbi:hypothetical protein ES705_24909 [subsurface metagenome]
MPSIPLTRNTWYRIVVHTVDSWGAFWDDQWHWDPTWATLAMWHGNDPDCYTRGSMVYGCDFWRSRGGYTAPAQDLLFQCDEAPSE